MDSYKNSPAHDELDFVDIVNGGETARRRIYLGSLMVDGYTQLGQYKVELLINETATKATYFEIVDNYVPLDTGISIQTTKEKYKRVDRDKFSYLVINNSDSAINIPLYVAISQYQEDRWIRLPFTQQYDEMHYNASYLSQNCQPNNYVNQQFRLSLFDMIADELPAGKYRLEKEILFDWYFAESE